MKHHHLVLNLTFCLLICSISLASPSEEMREFIRVTDLMKRMGIMVATKLSNHRLKSKEGLLLGIEPSSLLLVPEELEIGSKKKVANDSQQNDLVVLTDVADDLKLVCNNEIIEEHFPEWGITEVCKKGTQEIFAKFLKALAKRKSRLAISKSDLDDAPIVDVGTLKCMNLHGHCLSSRPSENELLSVLGLQEENSTSVAISSTPTTVIATTTSSSWSYTSLIGNEYPTRTISTDINPFKVHSTPDSLVGPPLYSEDPDGFEKYLSVVKGMTTLTTSVTSGGIVWIGVRPALKTTKTSTTEDEGP